MKIDNLETLKKVLENNTNAIIEYSTNIKLLKKNRATKNILTNEFPNLDKIIKTSIINAELNKSYIDKLNEQSKSADIIKVKSSPYKHITKNILQHKQTNKYYLQIFANKSTYQYIIKTKQADEQIKNDIDYILTNYGPIKQHNADKLKEKQNMNEAIIPLNLKLENIKSIEINNITYSIQLKTK